MDYAFTENALHRQVLGTGRIISSQMIVNNLLVLAAMGRSCIIPTVRNSATGYSLA